MEKKQTAVDWLEDYIQKEINKYRMHPMDLHAIHALNHIKEFACSKAKQMEKEQIQDAWDKRCSYGVVSQTWRVETTNGEQYYNETYGGQDVEVYSKNNTEKKYNCDYCHDMGAKYIGVPLGHLSCPQCKKY